MIVLSLTLLFGLASTESVVSPFAVSTVCDHDYGIPLKNVTSESLVMCCTECASLEECQTVVFDEWRETCRLNAAKALELPDAGCVGNAVKYAVFDKKGDYGVNCTHANDCTIPNFACTDGQCVCYWGFRHEPRNGTCSPGCARYGSEFDKLDNLRLEKNNDKQIENVTEAEALNLCVKETTFTCISIDCYKSSTITHTTSTTTFPVCWLSKESVVTRSFAIAMEIDYVYYQRKCV